MAHRIVSTTLFLPLLTFACGGNGGGGGGGGQPAAGNVVASAGQDFDAAATALVWLDAGASYEKTGAALTYSWTQTGGPAVVLTGAGTATPSFVAPSAGGDLLFSVSVSNGTQTAQDSLAVHVKPFVVRAGRLRTSQATSTGGAAAAGTKNFTIGGGTNFNASGVSPGDTLLVLDVTSPDFGAYRVNRVTSNTALSVQAVANFVGSTPLAWAILQEDSYFRGYGVAGALQAFVMGAPTGSLAFAWTGAPPWMPVAGAATASLSFTTPALGDLMEIPEEPGVLAVRATAAGLARFGVTVTDDAGTPGDPSDDVSDEETVDFSVGIATSGLENVPLGEPVFLSGGTVRKQEPNASFVLTGGAISTYQIAEVATVRAVRQAQTPLVEVTSIPAVDVLPGSWHWGAGILYVHATDSSSVVSNGRGYHAYVVDSWTWTLTDPTGANVSLFRPNRSSLGSATDERTPHFIPVRTGAYDLVLSRIYGSGLDLKSFTITAGQYTGVGTIVGIAPDPAQGECGSCHGGSVGFLENLREPWSQTTHAKVFAQALDPASPAWAALQAESDWRNVPQFRTWTTGTSFLNAVDLSRTLDTTALPSATASGHLPNKGFDDQALYRNWSHDGVTWDDLKDREPDLAALGNIQCEACHGPGSLHAGNTAGIRKSVDEGVCGRCHVSQPTLWNTAAHSRLVVSPSGNATCVNCHEASASVLALNAAADLPEPRLVLWGNSAAPLPIVPEHERRAESCAVCHNPHVPTAGTAPGASSRQLRLVGQVTFLNGVSADAGKAALCYMCHNTRTNTTDFTPGTGHMALRRAPHAGNSAAEMIAKTNGIEYPGWTYQSSPHAIPSAFIVGGQTENERCITCHMRVTPGPGQSGHLAIGGHSWWMQQGGSGEPPAPAEVAGESSHSGGAVEVGTESFLVTGGPTFLGRIYAGDLLVLENGSDAGTYPIVSVDTGRRVTVNAPANFGGVSQPTLWRINSVSKYNTLACNQCHVAGPQFEVTARGDYDGDGFLETVQEETHGMLLAVEAAVEAAINDPALPKGLGSDPYTLTEASGRVAYRNSLGATRAFPGPSGSSPQQPDWDALTPDQQTQWLKIYKAAYNFFFVEVDRSEGIHNTGYTVGLLQSSYLDLTGLSLGDPFVPIPGYGP